MKLSRRLLPLSFALTLVVLLVASASEGALAPAGAAGAPRIKVAGVEVACSIAEPISFGVELQQQTASAESRLTTFGPGRPKFQPVVLGGNLPVPAELLQWFQSVMEGEDSNQIIKDVTIELSHAGALVTTVQLRRGIASNLTIQSGDATWRLSIVPEEIKLLQGSAASSSSGASGPTAASASATPAPAAEAEASTAAPASDTASDGVSDAAAPVEDVASAAPSADAGGAQPPTAQLPPRGRTVTPVRRTPGDITPIAASRYLIHLKDGKKIDARSVQLNEARTEYTIITAEGKQVILKRSDVNKVDRSESERGGEK